MTRLMGVDCISDSDARSRIHAVELLEHDSEDDEEALDLLFAKRTAPRQITLKVEQDLESCNVIGCKKVN